MQTRFTHQAYPAKREQPSGLVTPNDAAAALYPSLSDFIAFAEHKTGMGDLQNIHLLDLNDDFWAHTLGCVGNDATPVVFSTEEQSFRRFNPTKGIYEVVGDSVVLGILISNLNGCA
jgi:hypothetical protein